MKNTMSKEKIDKRVAILSFLYILGLLGMLSLVFAINITKSKPMQRENQPTYQNITAMWSLDKEGTKAADIKELGAYMDPETGVLSIYYLLPELNADTSLVYRSKDVYTRVLIDDEVLYETSVYDSPFYNKSPGNLWNMLNVGAKYSGKHLEIQITMVYDANAVTVDSLYLGDKADIIIGICADNSFGIVVSILLMLLGIVLVVIDFLPAYGRAKKRHGLWWVGLYALLTGLWGIIETNVIQFFVDDMRILQLMDNMLMVFSTVPLVLYIHSELGILQNKAMRILTYLSASYGVLCVLVQYSGVRDMHSMLAFTSVFSVTTDLMMSVWLISKCIKLKRSGNALINCLLITLGIILRSNCTVLETVRSLRADRLDRAGLIRVGMILLCVCFAIGSQIETYRIVEQGLKFDLVSKLAYSDGLTGLGNRTAYLESVETYKNIYKEFKQLGVVYLDVNDLKKVNDNLGHEYGDKLIRTAAKIIEDSFGAFGKPYRVGGDEFCVLMTGNNIEENYKKALVSFQELLEEENNKGTNEYTIRIAHGFSICEDVSENGVEEAIAKADSEMYKNKAMLKGLA